MNPIVAQQTALDNALVIPDDRFKIRKCNMRINPSKTQKEPTYQVVLDALALSPCYPAFLITADICPRLQNQEFDEPPSDEEIISFVKELGYKGDIRSVTKVYTDHMHQPWRTFAAIINKCLSGKTTGLDKIRLSRAQILWGMFYKKNVDFVDLIWEDFMFEIDNRDYSAKRKENMPYPRFTKAIIQHFISKDKSISMRNRMFMHTVRDDSVLGTLKFIDKSEDNQLYGALIPIKPDFPSKKQTLIITEEPAKKPAARRQPSGVQIRDTPGVSVSQKKAPTKAKRNKGINLLSKAALLEESQMKRLSKGANEKHTCTRQGKSINTHVGTGLKLGVPDVSKDDSSNSKYESWRVGNDDDDDDDDDQQKEAQEVEFLHTLDDYVPTNDETDDVDDEEYDRINKEMYDDVNVVMKDAKLVDKGKGDEEKTDAKK
ncbi:hypothetical protein Tco_1055772 [Tanacetum coccineum]|uniref:Uncharacterized protein n=1 Tax=Tanacetum coccineum TaxID=301880 RepID=A0ABQ5H1A3_9ASTR